MATGARKKTYARRRARRVKAAANDLVPSQWEQAKTYWGGCAYCGKSGAALQKDCVQPIAHGGSYTIANVVPACRSCNASKCDSEVTTWLRRKHLDESEFLRRFVAFSTLTVNSDMELVNIGA